MVKTDRTTHDYYARLSSFYHQFIRIGNNYNQIVKAINTHFSERRLPRQLYDLYRATRELHTLCQQIIDLTKDYEKRKEENRHDA